MAVIDYYLYTGCLLLLAATADSPIFRLFCLRHRFQLIINFTYCNFNIKLISPASYVGFGLYSLIFFSWYQSLKGILPSLNSIDSPAQILLGYCTIQWWIARRWILPSARKIQPIPSNVTQSLGHVNPVNLMLKYINSTSIAQRSNPRKEVN